MALSERVKALLRESGVADEAIAKLDTSKIVGFADDGEFLSAADKKARKRAEEAATEARRKALADLELDDDEESLTKAREALKGTKRVLGEHEKLQREHQKTAQERDDLARQNAALVAFKRTTLAKSAVATHAAEFKVNPELLDLLADSLAPRVNVGDDDAIDEGAVKKLIESAVKSRPSLKMPDFKAGSGSGKDTPTPVPGAKNGAPPPDNRPLAVRMADQMAEQIKQQQ